MGDVLGIVDGTAMMSPTTGKMYKKAEKGRKLW